MTEPRSIKRVLSGAATAGACEAVVTKKGVKIRRAPAPHLPGRHPRA